MDAQFLAGLAKEEWDKPVLGGSKEWTLQETAAHLCAVNGARLKRIQPTDWPIEAEHEA